MKKKSNDMILRQDALKIIKVFGKKAIDEGRHYIDAIDLTVELIDGIVKIPGLRVIEVEKEKEQNRIKEHKRRIRCRKLAYEICKYYKEKKDFKEWHVWVNLKNKPELNMEDCYAIELTYKVLFGVEI